MKRLITTIFLSCSLFSCTIAPDYTRAVGSDVVGNVHHYGVIGVNGKSFIVNQAAVDYYNNLILLYGKTPQNTGKDILVGFIPALKPNYGVTKRKDNNFDMTEEAYIKYRVMINYADNQIPPQK